MKLAKLIAVFLGVCNIIFALMGLFSIFLYLPLILMNKGSITITNQLEEPFFYHAFYIMTAICMISYLLLFAIGFQFTRRKLGSAPWFTGLLIFELLYFLSLGIFPAWFSSEFDNSVLNAAGFANGGLMPQFLTAYPLWAPIAAVWARNRIRDGSQASV